MAIHEGAGQLAKSVKTLLQHWEETKLAWDDSVSRSFEERFIEPLRADAQKAAEAMGAMATLLEQIRRECS